MSDKKEVPINSPRIDSKHTIDSEKFHPHQLAVKITDIEGLAELGLEMRRYALGNPLSKKTEDHEGHQRYDIRDYTRFISLRVFEPLISVIITFEKFDSANHYYHLSICAQDPFNKTVPGAVPDDLLSLLPSLLLGCRQYLEANKNISGNLKHFLKKVD